MPDAAARYAAYRARLPRYGQAHLLRFWDQLDEERRAALLDSLDQIDFDRCAPLIEPYVRSRPQMTPRGEIAPADIWPAHPTPQLGDRYAAARARGENAIRAGEVAAFLVAGGQGTRLGYDGPKGAFRISPVRNVPLFQWFAEYLRGVEQRYGRAVNWYIMTSPQNHAATIDFFAEHENFALPADQIMFFQQAQMPAFLPDGRIALATPSEVALSPDGHGGSLHALARSGALEKMRARGEKYISYFQVDNPLVHCVDPLFLGLHIETGSEMSSKAVPKAGSRERVGNFCTIDGRVEIIEYSDLPDDLADATNPDGTPRFNAGSIAIHILSREFVERLTATGAKVQLPWHRADKVVPTVDDAGHPVKPTAPNAVKLEMFVFDAIPLARKAMVLYTERAEEFAPVKNAEGADSPATARAAISDRGAAWLRACGAALPDGADTRAIEISPAYAITCEHLRDRRPLPAFSGSPILLA